MTWLWPDCDLTVTWPFAANGQRPLGVLKCFDSHTKASPKIPGRMSMEITSSELCPSNFLGVLGARLEKFLSVGLLLVCMCMCVCVCVCVYVCMCMCMCKCVYVCMRVCGYVCMYAHVWMWWVLILYVWKVAAEWVLAATTSYMWRLLIGT